MTIRESTRKALESEGLPGWLVNSCLEVLNVKHGKLMDKEATDGMTPEKIMARVREYNAQFGKN